MKLLKMILLSSTLAPAVALAQPQPTPSEPEQPTTPMEQHGANMPEHDTGMSKGTQAFGLTAKPLSADKRSTYGGPKDAGLIVTKVESGSAAESAGIKAGDVITKIDDAPMSTTDDLTKAWKQDQGGEKSTAAIEVVRDHQTKSLQVTLKSETSSGQKQPEQQAPKGGY
jgi:C-terminal processing protease CtpA/Prc